MAVHDELVSLRYTSKNACIIQDQTVALRTGTLLKEQARREACKPPADHDAVIRFTGFGKIGGRLVKLSIADLVSVLNYLLGVSRRILVVALAGIACPPRPTDLTGARSLSMKRERAGRGQQNSRRPKKDAIKEITAGNGLIHAENLIEMRAFAHRAPPFNSLPVAASLPLHRQTNTNR